MNANKDFEFSEPLYKHNRLFGCYLSLSVIKSRPRVIPVGLHLFSWEIYQWKFIEIRAAFLLSLNSKLSTALEALSGIILILMRINGTTIYGFCIEIYWMARERAAEKGEKWADTDSSHYTYADAWLSQWSRSINLNVSNYSNDPTQRSNVFPRLSCFVHISV